MFAGVRRDISFWKKGAIMQSRTEEGPHNLPGTPAEGYRVVADIVATNTLQFNPTDNAMDVAIDIVSSHDGGGPVVGSENEFLGFINEGDVIRALEGGVDLQRSTAQDIMNSAFVAVTDDTALTSVAHMFEMGLRVLPVVKDGKVTRSVTRHDYLRARLGVGPGIEE
jgi:predicted transcriptional regulator